LKLPAKRDRAINTACEEVKGYLGRYYFNFIKLEPGLEFNSDADSIKWAIGEQCDGGGRGERRIGR